MENQVTTVTTYTQARAELAALCDEVASTREPVIIRRRNAEDVALVSADELTSLLETAHLLRSPKNAQRLLAAINRAQSRVLPPSSVEELRVVLDADRQIDWAVSGSGHEARSRRVPGHAGSLGHT